MEISNAYAICAGSVFALMAGWHLAEITAQLRHRAVVWTQRQLLSRIIYRWRSMVFDISPREITETITIYCVNAAACVLRVPNISYLAQRVGVVGLLNMVPLYLGGRTGFIVKHILGLSLRQHNGLHARLGWVFLLEIIVHAGLSAWINRSWPQTLLPNSVLALVALLAISSTAFIRRGWHELFLKVHLACIMALNALLWFHIPLRWNLNTLCLALSSTLWIVQLIPWIIHMIYQNSRSRAVQRCSLIADGEVVLIHLSREEPWTVRHGQYLYITMTALPNSWVGRFQSHPYMIAWENTRNHTDASSDGKNGQHEQVPCPVVCSRKDSTLSFLVESNGDFGKSLRTKDSVDIVFVDGPHGAVHPLETYDRVLFFASDTGIAAHLLAIRHLLKSHENLSGRVRRVSLAWYTTQRGHDEWIMNTLKELMDQDEWDKAGRKLGRRIFTIYICTEAVAPSAGEPNRPKQVEELDMTGFEALEGFPRILKCQVLSVCGLIKEEWRAEAGSMVVAVCANPSIESDVRSSLRVLGKDINLVTSPYRLRQNSSDSKV